MYLSNLQHFINACLKAGYSLEFVFKTRKFDVALRFATQFEFRVVRSTLVLRIGLTVVLRIAELMVGRSRTAYCVAHLTLFRVVACVDACASSLRANIVRLESG